MIFNRKKKKPANIAKKMPVKKPQKASKNSEKMAKKKPQDLKKQPILLKFFYMVIYFGIAMATLLFFGLWLYGIELSNRYKLSDKALDGVLWELPSRVYARPLELYVGRPLKIANLKKELDYLEYRDEVAVPEPGTFHINGNEILIYKRAFTFWDGQEKANLIRVTVKKNKITDLMDLNDLNPIAITRIEPLLVGSIYPKHHQDRILINLDKTPTILVDTLLATEDRRFYSHAGIDPRGLIRAIYKGIKSKKGIRQGASTITQQFVKNHYLTRERRISRKVKEAIIAVILEKYYSKKQILEGYLNEIFLGQDGDRSIHGFGLASEFYFGKPLNELGVHQIATLVSLVREPGRANPFKHPQYAKKRRALILSVMVGQNLISQREADLAKSLPLDVLAKSERSKKDRYYSFLQLVYHQLNEEYDSKKLASGLNVFTTLDPIIQEKAEHSVANSLQVLEENHRLKKNFLQAASVIVNTSTAEVIAIVGDRDPTRKGFNRAIQARRQPGSLLKPVVYMTALEYPQRYSLSTIVDNAPLIYKSGSEVWAPKNYSKRETGKVLLIDALVHSYNIPTARIALDIGIHDIVGRLQDLGARKGLPEFPSIVLGSIAMSPFEIAQIYEPLANGGYRMPLRVITSITDTYGNSVTRYPMQSVKVISDGPYYLTIKAMQEVVKRGTARGLSDKISPKLQIAGKTGTTDDYRDSWFAGFSGNYLNVIWVGNDNNKKIGLSGSRGAMRVWMDIMKDLPLKPLVVKKPNNIFDFEIDFSTGELMSEACRGIHQSANLPFIGGSEPTVFSECIQEQPIELDSVPVEDGNNDDLWYNQQLKFN
ncbi:MAG: penicillin-binding protein 1B [Ostreibacterium sp.]